ncbi:hypothetical protein SNOG_05375 [Parastagonospora nodorum SN15]|uniref:Uncharacterized protein n=1 Tax=Phaeosphaeria nodorum (strain SN15 / ATCC MYA-4574 / FGSC 10173) TaxID=321614 RepID=Q0US89_PHANO|nr:hypothetical protein SNOG_05375 [Parastagonospora nodorum SN15]EAT87766.1 hypothetical protein SNOG_05375 [Parastagonospora nodorum SN15]
MSYGVHDNVGDVKSVVQVSETKRKGNARVMPDGRLITTMREMADAMTTEIYRQLVPQAHTDSSKDGSKSSLTYAAKVHT